MSKIYVIGIGNKARQGKDQSAEYICELRRNVHIIHFADSLKNECINIRRTHPLIIQKMIDDDLEHYIEYQLLDNAATGQYKNVRASQLQYLHKIFTDRHITSYDGMDSKDAPILQFWGTDFRRNLCDGKYWIKRVNEKIQDIIELTNTDDDIYILLPDTRFKNEYSYIKTFRHGIFLRVERWTEDRSMQMLSSDRASNHPSEIELDTVKEDYIIQATNLDELKNKNNEFLKYFERLD